ncbi:MAG TPA: tetraacyldisaccharide 4'-kinase [Rhizomicrobium sp.]
MRQPDSWWHTTPRARIVTTALAPLGFLYGASVAWKSWRSDPYRAKIPVICVGNLTVGGSGKTPVAIAIAGLLQQQGVSPAFLSRGYGRIGSNALIVDPESHDASAVGDEAMLLARVAPAIVSADRAAGARIAEGIGVQCIIMDDGYQNFSLHKDISFLVVDGQTGFGNGSIIPAGPLREPVQQGLKRADAVVLMGDGNPSLPGYHGPVLRARLSPLERPDNGRMLAFAGIGRPEKFFATLRQSGATLVETHGFSDHHVYSAPEIARLRARATEAGATLVTTEKDFLRLSPNERKGIAVLYVRATFEDEATLTTLLAPLMARARS